MKKNAFSALEYILSFLLLVLNLINYESRINSILFLMAGTALFSSLFFVCFKKSESFLAACMMMLCHTWQISWINIFGAPITSLQLPWFYLIGLLLALFTLAKLKSLYSKPVNAFFLALVVFVLIISTFPFFTSPSKSEALKDYIMILFYIVLVFVAFLFSNSVSLEAREHILSAYSWCVFISCFFIIFQTVAYQFFGISLFYQSEGYYFGKATFTSGLLMGDLSSASIMLGSAVFIAVVRIEKKQRILLNSLQLVVTVIGLALTSRRTGALTLVLVLSLYAITHYKSAFKKIAALILFSIVTMIMGYYLLFSRSIDSISTLFYENNRMSNYINVLQTILTHPFGVGYDDTYARTFMADNVAPHNTFLRWMLMGGPIFSIALMAIPLYTLVCAFKKKLTCEFWIILYALLASNFIPDLLTAKFFVIPCMCALLVFKTPEKSSRSKLLNGRR
ncbi:MAG: hypothetical protein IJA52_06750 [Clostridia bacterium]|nr:hypothetical protein [Clostridia bacterium]